MDLPGRTEEAHRDHKWGPPTCADEPLSAVAPGQQLAVTCSAVPV